MCVLVFWYIITINISEDSYNTQSAERRYIGEIIRQTIRVYEDQGEEEKGKKFLNEMIHAYHSSNNFIHQKYEIKMQNSKKFRRKAPRQPK